MEHATSSRSVLSTLSWQVFLSWAGLRAGIWYRRRPLIRSRHCHLGSLTRPSTRTLRCYGQFRHHLKNSAPDSTSRRLSNPGRHRPGSSTRTVTPSKPCRVQSRAAPCRRSWKTARRCARHFSLESADGPRMNAGGRIDVLRCFAVEGCAEVGTQGASVGISESYSWIRRHLHPSPSPSRQSLHCQWGLQICADPVNQRTHRAREHVGLERPAHPVTQLLPHQLSKRRLKTTRWQRLSMTGGQQVGAKQPRNLQRFGAANREVPCGWAACLLPARCTSSQQPRYRGLLLLQAGEGKRRGATPQLHDDHHCALHQEKQRGWVESWMAPHQTDPLRSWGRVRPLYGRKAQRRRHRRPLSRLVSQWKFGGGRDGDCQGAWHWPARALAGPHYSRMDGIDEAHIHGRAAFAPHHRIHGHSSQPYPPDGHRGGSPMPPQTASGEGHGPPDATTHHYRWMGSSRVVQTSLPSLSRPSSSQCTVAAWEVSLRSSRPRSAKRLASHMSDMCVTWGTCVARFVTWVTCILTVFCMSDM